MSLTMRPNGRPGAVRHPAASQRDDPHRVVPLPARDQTPVRTSAPAKNDERPSHEVLRGTSHHARG